VRRTVTVTVITVPMLVCSRLAEETQRLSMVSLNFDLHLHIPWVPFPFEWDSQFAYGTQNCLVLPTSQTPPTRIEQRFNSSSKWWILGHWHTLLAHRKNVIEESQSLSAVHLAWCFVKWPLVEGAWALAGSTWKKNSTRMRWVFHHKLGVWLNTDVIGVWVILSIWFWNCIVYCSFSAIQKDDDKTAFFY